MMTTTYRDGYGLAVELFHADPEVCPDGVTRTWVTVAIRDEVAGGDVEYRVQPVDLRDLAAVLVAVADAHDGGAR